MKYEIKYMYIWLLKHGATIEMMVDSIRSSGFVLLSMLNCALGIVTKYSVLYWKEVMKDNSSYKTAIARKTKSAPLTSLLNKINKNEKILDFGCGRGGDHKWLKDNGYAVEKFDPYWAPSLSPLHQTYDVILCTYVLNVIPKEERERVIRQLSLLLNPSGRAYVSVRRDIKEDKVSKNNTHQYVVKLPYPIVKSNSSFCIYEVRK